MPAVVVPVIETDYECVSMLLTNTLNCSLLGLFFVFSFSWHAVALRSSKLLVIILRMRQRTCADVLMISNGVRQVSVLWIWKGSLALISAYVFVICIICEVICG
jgi:hypothetical protein